MKLLFLAGMFINVFLVGLLVLKKGRAKSDQVLLEWLSFLLVHQFFIYMDVEGLYHLFPHIIGIEFAFPTAHPVFLFLYAKAILNEKVNLKRKLVFFSPAVVLVVLMIPFYMLSGAEKIHAWEHWEDGSLWYDFLEDGFMLLSGFVFICWTYFLIRDRIKNSNEASVSPQEMRKLNWLRHLLSGLLLIWVGILVFDSILLVFSLVSLFVLFIGFKGVSRMAIFSSDRNLPVLSGGDIAVADKVRSRYAKSGLSNGKSEQLYDALLKLMENEGLYKQSDLSLNQVATKLDSHPNYVSQIINVKEGKNFYNYINQLRVEEFLRVSVLPENEHYTILSLAYDCGFNSKSTFNKHFKIVTGQTPSQYLKVR